MKQINNTITPTITEEEPTKSESKPEEKSFVTESLKEAKGNKTGWIFALIAMFMEEIIKIIEWLMNFNWDTFIMDIIDENVGSLVNLSKKLDDVFKSGEDWVREKYRYIKDELWFDMKLKFAEWWNDSVASNIGDNGVIELYNPFGENFRIDFKMDSEGIKKAKEISTEEAKEAYKEGDIKRAKADLAKQVTYQKAINNDINRELKNDKKYQKMSKEEKEAYKRKKGWKNITNDIIRPTEKKIKEDYNIQDKEVQVFTENRMNIDSQIKVKEASLKSINNNIIRLQQNSQKAQEAQETQKVQEYNKQIEQLSIIKNNIQSDIKNLKTQQNTNIDSSSNTNINSNKVQNINTNITKNINSSINNIKNTNSKENINDNSHEIKSMKQDIARLEHNSNDDNTHSLMSSVIPVNEYT